MKTVTNLGITLLLLLLANASSVYAGIIYDADNKVTGLTGLNVEDAFYDIRFSNGVIGDTWRYEQVNAPGWGSLADSISIAVARELDSMGIMQPEEILGCDWYSCDLFLPDSVSNETDPEYTDHSMVWSHRIFFGGTWYGSPGWEYHWQLRLEQTFAASADASSSDSYVLMTFEPTTVPVPATTWLFGIAILAFRIVERKRA